ncbi:MAG: NnrS family protein [Proteobacteria bacterium]|nr:NnrS family protein [Pseudomonadota bacterium]
MTAARRVAGNAFFFPAATLYAIFVLPASVLAMFGRVDGLAALATPAGHAHEMLFGFALAVVAGNQLGPTALPRLALLAGLWLAARIAFLASPLGLVAAAANIGFAALLALQLAPRLFASAKKLRNQALPLVLTAICASAIAIQLAPGFPAAAPGVAVLLYALLMLFMGGRLIAPLVAGQFHKQGVVHEARVQPRIEGALLASMAVAAVAAGLGQITLAAITAAAAGVLAAVRMFRWRLWALQRRADLLCLAAGYGWLAAGLVAYGAALAAGRHQTAALHLITVGALGTLTLNVMAMSWTLKARQDPARAAIPVWGTLLVAAAVLARVLAGLGYGDPPGLMLLAALCWSCAFGLLLVRLARTRPARR